MLDWHQQFEYDSFVAEGIFNVYTTITFTICFALSLHCIFAARRKPILHFNTAAFHVK